MNPRQIWAVAKADFRERMRRPPVYFAMAVGAFLCYLTFIDQATVTVGNGRGVWNSAWSAGTLAVFATSYITLVCFFVIRNGVQRDEESGTGKLVATTTVSDFSYLLGKCASNFVVLLTVMAVFLLASPLLQWSRHAGTAYSVWGFLNPFLYVTVPAAAFIAGLAVFGECHPWLKRGLGNVLYIAAWTEMVRESAMDARGWTDMVGFYSFMSSVQAAARAQGVKLAENSLNIGHAEFDHWDVYKWDGFTWHWKDLLLRGEWFAVAFALVFLASFFFDRFNPDAPPAIRLRMPAFFRRTASFTESFGKWDTLSHLTPLQGLAGRNRFFAVVQAELKLLLKSIPKILYLALAIANLIAALSPEKDGPGIGVLAFLWIVPVLTWSQMGAREQAPYARPLIFSAPHSLLRQLPAEWLAGFLIAIGASFGVGIRLWSRGHLPLFLVWVAGAMFISSLAIACGTWTRGTRLFQGLYPAWWYLALNKAPGMDFMGITGQRHALGYAIFSAALFASTMAHRWWNTERASALQILGLLRGRQRRVNVAAV